MRRLDDADNDALLALASTSSTGSDAFRVERSPDFFALGRFLGDPTYLGVFEGETLAGCIGLTRQPRFFEGDVVDMVYVHDLRVDPRFRATGAIVPLLEAAADEHRGGWTFATVLAGSPHRPSFERRLRRFAGPVSPLGRTVHLGCPLFAAPRPLDGAEVGELPAVEGAATYLRLARDRCLAPAAIERVLAVEGPWLGVAVCGRVMAVAKLVDQSPVRRIVAGPGGGLGAVLRFASRVRGCPPFPRRGEALEVGYLALYAAEDERAYDLSLFAHLGRTARARHTYVFRGMDEREAARRPLGRLGIRFASTTYALGRWAEGASLDYHELTLI